MLCLSVRLPSEVCKSATQAPGFKWVGKYYKATKGLGVVKQALAPSGATLTKLSQQRKTGWSFSLVFAQFHGQLMSVCAGVSWNGSVSVLQCSG